MIPAAACLAAVAGLSIWGWQAARQSPEETAPTQDTQAERKVPLLKATDPGLHMKPFVDQTDVRWERNYILRAGQFDPAEMETYIFSSDTVFEDAQELADAVLKNGMNPGLGIRTLHEQGITGEGVRVAIIDQNLIGNHPEYAGKIEAYYDSGCDQPENDGSMHGPAVLSLLAGESVGTAPGVLVYYAAAPSWEGDAAYFADCLDWIVEQNEALPEGDKIRLVSVSAAPSVSEIFANGERWDAAVDRAEEAGILVISADGHVEEGFILPGYYDPDDPENVKAFHIGWPDSPDSFPEEGSYPAEYVFVPSSYRTVAMEPTALDQRYTYWSQGGLSWAIPYAAGVLALGWQVNPSLDAQTMKDLLLQACLVKPNGARIINPRAFIALVKDTVS